MQRRTAALTLVVSMGALLGCGAQNEAPSSYVALPLPSVLADNGVLPPGHPPVPGHGYGRALPEGHPPIPGLEGEPALPEGHPRCPARGFQASPPAEEWEARSPAVIST